jgi:4-hydroxy-3-polyprenylbenzoate decarboxylase
MQSIKMILYVEDRIDPTDLPTALWRFANNLDPRRDHWLFEMPAAGSESQRYACMSFDGTRKTRALDDFERDWPNIIVADPETISSVDEKWNQLGLGALLTSPSLKFLPQLYGQEAAAEGGGS